MIVRLLVANDKANVKKVVLRNDSIVGRSSDCNLRIASNEVSRRHCSILLSELPVRIRDLGSSNGTFLNGTKIQANTDVPLPSGSELEIGNVRFVVQYHLPVETNEPGSTAEVDNAELVARLKEPTPEASPADSVVPLLQATRAESPAEIIEQDTSSDSGSDTVNETVNEVRDDAEAAATEQEQSAQANDEMTVSEEAVTDVAPTDPSAVPQKSGGWKSLFGVFRKSRPAEDTPPDATANSANAAADETIADFANAAELDETIRMPLEETGEPEYTAPQNIDETIAMPFDDEAAVAGTGDSGTAIHSDHDIETMEAAEIEEPAEVEQADDENLQDFFQRLSQD